MATNEDCADRDQGTGAPLGRHLERAVLLEVAFLGEGWAPH